MNKKHVLLVEDNCDDEELTLMAFEQSSTEIQVNVVRDGAEALDYLFKSGAYINRDSSNDPNIVLLDLKLPKINGLEVLRHIRDRETTRSLPVVILTTSKNDQDIIDSYNLGCNSYVQKPVDFSQFLNAAKQLGLYWLGLNETIPK